MLKYTNHTLKKMEQLYSELDYKLLYAKGNFKSGYCIVDEKRIVVINKFYDTEARINCLVEILGKIEFDPRVFSEKSLNFFQTLQSETHGSRQLELNPAD